MVCTRRMLSRSLRETRGTVLIETALILPLLILMFYGVVEVSRYILYREKLQSAVLQSLDVINQNTNVNAASLDHLFHAIPTMMAPYAFTNPQVLVTQVIRPSDLTKECAAVAVWHYPAENAGISKVAKREYAIADTGGIVLRANDSLMSFEVMADYTPILDTSFIRKLLGSASLRLYKVGYVHARYRAFSLHPQTGRPVRKPCKQSNML